MTPPPEWSVVIVAGGRGTRLGGADKALVRISGARGIDRLLSAIDATTPVVVAGAPVPTERPVEFRLEQPPDGGPVAGIAAALEAVRTPNLVLLAVDMPFAGTLLPALVAAFIADGGPGVVAQTPDGRAQYLFSAWRTSALTTALARLGSVRDRPMRDLVAAAHLAPWTLTAAQSGLLIDIDTPEDLIRARELA